MGAKEIEETILEIPEVHETAVIGIDDQVLGEAILALVILKEKADTDPERILYYLKEKLP